MPDAEWGEVGRAYVIVLNGQELTAEVVLDHCKMRLARYKTPASVVFTDTIPRTASGKVQKQVLRARAHEDC
jgi:fatty-acyl-CoA synthase